MRFFFSFFSFFRCLERVHYGAVYEVLSKYRTSILFHFSST